jgi:formiminotetrahydrofolate cyclodeaminase
MSVSEYTRRLASADPTPGGGSSAAAVGAFAAGLVRMVAQLTSNAPKFADVADRANALGASAATIVDQFVSCIDDDVVAFDRVSAA